MRYNIIPPSFKIRLVEISQERFIECRHYHYISNRLKWSARDSFEKVPRYLKKLVCQRQSFNFLFFFKKNTFFIEWQALAHYLQAVEAETPSPFYNPFCTDIESLFLRGRDVRTKEILCLPLWTSFKWFIFKEVDQIVRIPSSGSSAKMPTANSWAIETIFS